MKSIKVIRRVADKQGEAKMLQELTTVSLPQTYCRSCHLSTRSDLARCLHCNKLLAAPVAPSRKTPRRPKARRHSR